MDKITYLAELAEGLARWVPERERRDILRYYAEYFDEAGPGREAEVVAELGDPWALSCRLAVDGGYVTHEKAASWRPKKTWRRVLLGTAVGLTVFALVFGIGLLAVNVVRAVSYTAPVSVVEAIPGGMAYEWGYNAFNAVPVDDPSVMGPYLIDGESVNAFHSIDIDISLGNIKVVAGDDYTLSIGRGEALIGYEPVLEIRNGVLRFRDSDLARQVQVDSWDDLKSLFSVGRDAMDVTVTVPQNVVLNNIRVKTGLGDVLLYGLFADTVTVETGMGDVECYEARCVRRLELNTGMGDVNLDLEKALDGLYIGLKTGMGDVEATLCGFEMDYSYSLESGMGAVSVNGSYWGSKVERRGNQPYRLDAESGGGDVSIWFTFD